LKITDDTKVKFLIEYHLSKIKVLRPFLQKLEGKTLDLISIKFKYTYLRYNYEELARFLNRDGKMIFESNRVNKKIIFWLESVFSQDFKPKNKNILL